MADKTLSTPQRSEGPFHASPWAKTAAESWWPAGPLDPCSLMPSAASACGVETRGHRGCVTHMGAPTNTHADAHSWLACSFYLLCYCGTMCLITAVKDPHLLAFLLCVAAFVVAAHVK